MEGGVALLVRHGHLPPDLVERRGLVHADPEHPAGEGVRMTALGWVEQAVPVLTAHDARDHYSERDKRYSGED